MTASTSFVVVDTCAFLAHKAEAAKKTQKAQKKKVEEGAAKAQKVSQKNEKKGNQAKGVLSRLLSAPAAGALAVAKKQQQELQRLERMNRVVAKHGSQKEKRFHECLDKVYSGEQSKAEIFDKNSKDYVYRVPKTVQCWEAFEQRLVETVLEEKVVYSL